MPRVRGDGSDLLTATVQSECVEPLVRHPEWGGPPLATVGGPLKERVGAFVLEADQDLGHPLKRQVLERLLLDGRDRPLRDRAVAMPDALVRILPALIAEPAWRSTVIGEESIAVPIPVHPRPLHRSEGGVEMPPQQIVVSRPVPELAQS